VAIREIHVTGYRSVRNLRLHLSQINVLTGPNATGKTNLYNSVFLLAKAAAAFSAVRLNIVEADVFTRADNVVLDTFTITGADGHSPASASQMEQMGFLLEGALSEPPRFASVWACSRHKYLAPTSHVVPKIFFDNDSADSTLVHVETPDRLGLLYDILQAVSDCGLNIKQALINTEKNLARDVIHVTNESGQKLLEKGQLDSLRAKLEKIISLNGNLWAIFLKVYSAYESPGEAPTFRRSLSGQRCVRPLASQALRADSSTRELCRASQNSLLARRFISCSP